MIDDSEAFLALPPALRDALPGHPWHVAPYTAMADILKEGIRPDAAPVWSSGRCRSWGGISLFDFRGDLAIIARQFDVWQPWVRGAQGGRRCKVWLRLDPGKLTGEPLLPQRVWDDHKRAGAAGDDRYNPIPKVEACHIGVIDVEAIIDAILIYAWDCTQFRRVPDVSALPDALAEFLPLCPEEFRDPKNPITPAERLALIRAVAKQ